MKCEPRVGLMVGRFQPLHRGHLKSINRMIQDCETAVICLGSAQRSREQHDPWTVDERMQMIKNVYADRVKIVPLNDLNAATPKQWTDYIFEKLTKLGMKEPTDYYTGSIQDGYWYKHCFWGDEFWSDSDEQPNKLQFYNGETKRLLHLIDRGKNEVPAATEIRGFLQLRSNRWMDWVPAVNHKLVHDTYPEEFKVPINE